MDGILRVTPEQLISTASEFSSQGSTIQNLTSEMVSMVGNLASAWEGEAATTYINKFNGLEDDISLMIRMVQEHATDLQEMAQTYQQAEAQNVEDFGTLSSDVIQ